MRNLLPLMFILFLSASVHAKIRTIVLDPSAGGTSTGIQTRLFIEKELTLSFAKKIQAQIKKGRTNATLTRFDDYPLTSDERISIANQEKNATWISLQFTKTTDTPRISIYTINTISSKRRETSFMIPIEKVHNPWIERSVLLAQTLQETFPPELTPTVIRSDIPIRSLLGVNHPAVMIEIELDTKTMQYQEFQSLLDELAERISIAVKTFIKREKRL